MVLDSRAVDESQVRLNIWHDMALFEEAECAFLELVEGCERCGG